MAQQSDLTEEINSRVYLFQTQYEDIRYMQQLSAFYNFALSLCTLDITKHFLSRNKKLLYRKLSVMIVSLL